MHSDNLTPPDAAPLTPPDGDTAPAFVLPDIDEDIRADFAAIGLVIGDDNVVVERDLAQMEQAKREAVAAMFLRLASECTDEIDRCKAAMLTQVQIITTHYERVMAGPARRREEFVRHVEFLALVSAESGGFGKKKSARTPYGDFGVADRKATVHLVDEAALLAYLVVQDPARVRVIAKMPLDAAREFLSPIELEAAKLEPLWKDLKPTLSPDGALPPGVEAVPASRVPFASPVEPAHLKPFIVSPAAATPAVNPVSHAVSTSSRSAA